MKSGLRHAHFIISTVLCLFFMLIPASIWAQSKINSIDDQIGRALWLQGDAATTVTNFRSYSTNFHHSLSNTEWAGVLARRNRNLYTGAVDISLVESTLAYSFNSAFPYGYYDAAQWQGKGSNLMIEGGAALEWNGLSVVLDGMFWYSANRDYNTVPVNGTQADHEYWWYDGGTIDYFQQPTSANAWGMSFGQSGLRYNGRQWTIGITHENIWIGPARYFPIMLSNQADGFWHFDVGTLGFVPIVIGDVNLGSVEARGLLGVAEESDYFDSDDSNDFNQVLGLTLGYAFPFQTNLRFGFNLLRRKNMLDFPSNFWQLFDLTDGGPTDTHNDKTDLQASFTMAWHFPEVGLEVYGEYARNDYSSEFSDYFNRLDKSNGYTFGMEKMFRLKKGDLLGFTFEFTDLFQVPYDDRANEPIWYKHFDVPQGHTHLGQLLGSPLGPGSDGQRLNIALYREKALWQWWLQRVSVDKDYFFYLTTYEGLSSNDNFALGILGTERTQLGRLLDWGVKLEWIIAFNYGYIPDNTIHNLHLSASVSY